MARAAGAQCLQGSPAIGTRGQSVREGHSGLGWAPVLTLGWLQGSSDPQSLLPRNGPRAPNLVGRPATEGLGQVQGKGPAPMAARVHTPGQFCQNRGRAASLPSPLRCRSSDLFCRHRN